MEHLKPREDLILSAAKNKAEAWRRWKMSWDLYKVVSGLDQKNEKIQVPTFLHVLAKECVEIFPNFEWDSEDDRDKIEAVEEKFKVYCDLEALQSLFVYRTETARRRDSR